MIRSFALALLLVAACDDDGGSSPPQDAAPDTTGSGCTGPCAVTAVTATFESTATLNQAWYGTSATTLYVEVDLGGIATCPQENSPTPTYSLVMGAVPIPVGTTPVMSGGAMLDNTAQGDLLGGPPVKSATSITLTPNEANPSPDGPNARLAFDITGTFPGGTVSGHLYATHCASMDQ